jgi:hypothetical protein
LLLLGLGGVFVLLLVGGTTALVIWKPWEKMTVGAAKTEPTPKTDAKAVDKKKDGEPKRDREPIEVTIEQINEECGADYGKFLTKFADREIRLTGILYGFPFGEGAFSIKYASLVTNLDKPGDRKGVRFVLQESQKDRLNDLVWGQQLKLRGKLDVKALGRVQLLDCEILEVGNPPAVFASLTAEELAKELAADRPGTLKKYAGKVIEVTGPTGQIYHADGGVSVSVTWNDPVKNFLHVGRIHVQGQGMDAAHALSWGQTVKIRGPFGGQSMWIIPGQFVEAGPDPAIVTTSVALMNDIAADRKAATVKYHLKPVRVEGKVAAIGKFGPFSYWKIELEGIDEGKAKPIRLIVAASMSKQQADALKVGQTIIVRGLMSTATPPLGETQLSFGGVVSIK